MRLPNTYTNTHVQTHINTICMCIQNKYCREPVYLKAEIFNNMYIFSHMQNIRVVEIYLLGFDLSFILQAGTQPPSSIE